MAVVNIYLHYDVPAGGVRWHYPPQWFWTVWGLSIWGSWPVALLALIRAFIPIEATRPPWELH